jgi:hypothetical protein
MMPVTGRFLALSSRGIVLLPMISALATPAQMVYALGG